MKGHIQHALNEIVEATDSNVTHWTPAHKFTNNKQRQTADTAAAAAAEAAAHAAAAAAAAAVAAVAAAAVQRQGPRAPLGHSPSFRHHHRRRSSCHQTTSRKALMSLTLLGFIVTSFCLIPT